MNLQKSPLLNNPWTFLWVLSFFPLLASMGCSDKGDPGIIFHTNPLITISDVSQAEGTQNEPNPENSFFQFTVTLSSYYSETDNVTVEWTTTEGSAKSGEDFVSDQGVLTFKPKESLSQTVSVEVNGDSVGELNEYFWVSLSNPINGTLKTTRGKGTIFNDDSKIFAVDPTSAGEQDGLSWETAFHVLQEAIDLATSNAKNFGETEEVWVAAGTHTNEANGGGIYPVLKMGDTENIPGATVNIYGGFSGYQSGLGEQETKRSERNLSQNETILNGNNSSYHVVEAASNSVLDGFTIQGGNAVGTSGNDDKGGGLISTGETDLRIENCIFKNNHASNMGGGLYGQGNTNLYIVRSLFKENTAKKRGGGLAVTNDVDNLIFNSKFFKNHTTEIPESFDGGGAIYNENSIQWIVNSVFNSNQSFGDGGAIYNVLIPGVSLINQSTFVLNQSQGYGGGLYHIGFETTQISNSIFYENTANQNPSVFDENNGVGITSYNSLLQGCTDPSDQWDVQCGNIHDFDLDSNPEFVTADLQGDENDNLELSSSSPCINSGDNSSLVKDYADLDENGQTDLQDLPLDLLENTRTINTIVDMGAFESSF